MNHLSGWNHQEWWLVDCRIFGHKALYTCRKLPSLVVEVVSCYIGMIITPIRKPNGLLWDHWEWRCSHAFEDDSLWKLNNKHWVAEMKYWSWLHHVYSPTWNKVVLGVIKYIKLHSSDLAVRCSEVVTGCYNLFRWDWIENDRNGYSSARSDSAR